MGVILTAELIEAFAGTFLSARYDEPSPTPDYHRQVWALYASKVRQAGCVAPRGHAKSTGLTFDYVLAEVCFRTADYVIVIGSTEEMAAEQLSNISEELQSNQDLRQQFGIVAFETIQKAEIIVVCDDGHRFRILARGGEQKIRGKLWNGKRPNLIVADDMEDDEQVESRGRRLKFKRWFFRAAKQALSGSGRIRVHGTILHDDGLLSHLRKNRAWKFLFFKAHKSYDDFSELLWPQRWSEAELRKVRFEFEETGDAGGYSQEYLNTPRDNNEAYIRKEHLIPMGEDDHTSPKIYGIGVDLAISTSSGANKTAFVVGGIDLANTLHVVDRRTRRMDALEIVDEFFALYERWHPNSIWVENGQIWLAIGPMLQREMEIRKTLLPIELCRPIKNKGVRGKAFQKRTRCGKLRVDQEADWYPAWEDVVLKFVEDVEAAEDDDFDATSWLCQGFEIAPQIDDDEFIEDDEWEMRRESLGLMRHGASDNRTCTGY